MPPLNVLDLRDTDEIGGPGKTILETGRALDRDRFRQHIGVFATSTESGDTPFTAAARGYDLPVHVISGVNQYDPRLIARTAALVRDLRIDLVHSHEVKSDVIARLAAAMHRVPLVTTLHGWIGNSPKQRAFIALDKRIVRGFDLIIAVSRPIHRAAIEAGVPPDRVQLLSNAIVLDRYRRQPGAGQLVEIMGRAPQAPVLCTIGRLSFEKGHADLLEALALLATRGHQMEAVLVGDGPERQALAARAQALGLGGRVHFAGYLDQPQRVLNDVDLMVLPSHTEGLPNAALEALAMDVPVLATRVGGTPEVIDDGRTGRLVAARDPAAMAAALEEFLAQRAAWASMASCGRQHVERHFDFQARTRRLEQMYLDVVNGARR